MSYVACALQVSMSGLSLYDLCHRYHLNLCIISRLGSASMSRAM